MPEKALTASTVQASRSSTRETPPPAATTPAAVRLALSTSGKEMRNATTWSGMAWSRTVTSVITASVPSEPIEKAGEVVAGGGLGGAAAGADDAAVGEDGFEGEDVGAGLAVADGGGAGGVGGGHAAEGGVGAGVDGEEEAVFAGGVFELEAGDACLDGGGEVAGGDLEDLVEAGEIEADAAVDGDDVAFEAGAGAEGDDRDAVGVGDLEHARDLGRRGRIDDEIGAVRRDGS